MRPLSLPSALFAAILATALPAMAQEALPNTHAERPAAPAQPSQGLDDPRWYPATGRDLAALIRDCDTGACMSYVAGAINGMSTRASIFGKDHPFCAGDDIGVHDIRDAVITAIDGDPELQEAPATFAILAAFSATWPCPEAGDTNTTGAQAQPPQAATNTIPVEAMTALDSGAGASLITDLTLVLEKGDPGAPLLHTLTVFHDPNCVHCAAFRAQTDALVNLGWRIRVVPVGIMSADSQGYAALMTAFAETRPDAVEALYREAEVGHATVAAGLETLAKLGITAPDALAAVSNSKAYEAVTAHNERMFALGGKGTPSWVVGDYLATGGAPAEAIADLANRLPVPPGANGLTRPTQDAQEEAIEPMLLPLASEPIDSTTDSQDTPE